MRKLFWAFGLLLLLAACGQREEAMEGNLILTNYAPEAISNITVEYGGETLSSEAAISDTQLIRSPSGRRRGKPSPGALPTPLPGKLLSTFGRTGRRASGTWSTTKHPEKPQGLFFGGPCGY